MEKTDLLIQRITKLVRELPQGAMTYELELLFTELTKQIDKIRKEAKKQCKTKLSNKE